ncbi:MAG: ABC transporter ATP-binding protein [Solirubrobacteraceae bacterium]|nr:ABC transporter ATP-binding protein [Solirubrobacteraceae bacterium]
MTGSHAKLEVEGLVKAFPAAAGRERVVALEGVDLRLAAGEFVSIVGPSGCGKSTLFNILAGLVRPSSGEVLLGGRRPQELLGKVGYMPQKDLLMPWRSVLDNVTLGLEMNGVKRREARRRAKERIARFGLAGFERRWPTNLSGGMRQRAALLRTFLAGREIMLLDEPFGALDALTRQAMQEWLLEIWQADRKTILFITHDVEEAVYLSDRVYVMSGRPGRMQLCVDVPLPRPRTFAMIASPEFVELKARLLRPLHEAATRQLEAQGAHV